MTFTLLQSEEKIGFLQTAQLQLQCVETLLPELAYEQSKQIAMDVQSLRSVSAAATLSVEFSSGSSC